MSKRQFEPGEPELMDRPEATPAELEAALTSLRGLNRWFGSYRLIMRFVRRWIRAGDRLRIADLATGSADIPRLVVDHARKVGAEVQIDAVDFQPTTVAMAQRLSAAYPEITVSCADVLKFGTAGAYDVVLCSLALHHFSDSDAVRVLQRCRELSRRFVLVSDLRRGFLASVGVHLLTSIIFRDPMTRSDARVSAQRAFTLSELRGLASRAGWRDFGSGKFPLARHAVWIESGARS
jgi:SAM-dependent methyltransferase